MSKGPFSHDPLHIIIRKRTLEQSTYIMKEQIGNEVEHMSLHDLKQRIQRDDNCIAQKIR